MIKQPSNHNKVINLILIYSLLLMFLIVISLFSITYKIEGLTFETVIRNDDPLLFYTIWNIRVPRLLLAIVLGAALATAGCLLQVITLNSLSDPEVIGINQGASCFAVLSILLFSGNQNSFAILIGAFVGASIVSGILFILSYYNANDYSRLLLGGVAISAFMGAFTTSFILFYETQLSEVLYWMAGKLSGAEWADNKIAWILNIPSITIAIFFANNINLLAQGEEIASGLGLKIIRTRQILGLLIIIMTGSSVAVAGPIGFIGLIVPHMVKRIVGSNHKVVLPMSALLGASLLAASDFAAQWVFSPVEIPVGIITAFLGVPFFLYLLRKRGGEFR
jgi:ABC-type Fe3+-siderophore transport system permease subunit